MCVYVGWTRSAVAEVDLLPKKPSRHTHASTRTKYQIFTSTLTVQISYSLPLSAACLPVSPLEEIYYRKRVLSV